MKMGPPLLRQQKRASTETLGSRANAGTRSATSPAVQLSKTRPAKKASEAKAVMRALFTAGARVAMPGYLRMGFPAKEEWVNLPWGFGVVTSEGPARRELRGR